MVYGLGFVTFGNRMLSLINLIVDKGELVIEDWSHFRLEKTECTR